LIYQELEATTNIEYVFTVMHELYNEYVKEHNSSVMEQNVQGNARESSSSSCSSNAFRRNVQSGNAIFQSFLKSVDTTQPVQSDLQRYLEEGVYIYVMGSDAEFNALEWWKANAHKFRILSKLARDILSIPITTVSSEYRFSAGGRVIDLYRASMSLEIVQMLVCGADWVNVPYGSENKSTVNVTFV
jgi:hypothetical protein